MQHDMYFLYKTYKFVNFVFGTKKLSKYDGFEFTESNRLYKFIFVLLSTIQLFIIIFSMDSLIEEIKKNSSLAHLALMMTNFIMLSVAHVSVILHGIFYGGKIQKSIMISIMRVDAYLNFPDSSNFKIRIVLVHSVYAFFKFCHLCFDMCTLDYNILLAQFLNHYSLIAFEVEILHYIIEINEVARRFEYLNDLLASSLNLKYTEGFLMKLWERKSIIQENMFQNMESSMKIYADLCQIVDDIVSCYGLTVTEIFYMIFNFCI